MAVAFANIYMGEMENQILNESAHKPLAWKRYIDDIVSLWHSSRDVIEKFIENANKQHKTIKFTAEISCTHATFSDTTLCFFFQVTFGPTAMTGCVSLEDHVIEGKGTHT